MLSDRLKARAVYKERKSGRYDPQITAVITKVVRKLILVMSSIEAHGLMPREDIENCVIDAIEKAEYLYYGLKEHDLMQLVEMEIKNDKGRKGTTKGF